MDNRVPESNVVDIRTLRDRRRRRAMAQLTPDQQRMEEFAEQVEGRFAEVERDVRRIDSVVSRIIRRLAGLMRKGAQ